MKLELKYLVSYLPYGLEFITGDGIAKLIGIPDVMVNKDVIKLHFGANLKKKKFDFGYANSDFNKPSNFGYYYINTIILQNINNKADVVDYSSNKVTPLLLPLSALTEPLKYGSIPILELAKIAFPSSKTIKLNNEDGTAIIDTAENYSFKYKDNSFECVYLRYSPRVQLCYVPNQLQLFEYLFANHFDVYGLIDAGLAIDKRTLKPQP